MCQAQCSIFSMDHWVSSSWQPDEAGTNESHFTNEEIKLRMRRDEILAPVA